MIKSIFHRKLAKGVMALFVVSLLSFVSSVAAETNQDEQATATAVPVESVVLLDPSNTRISFVGTHVGDDPKPRLGGFGEFSGTIKVDPAKQTLTAISVDIDVDSIWTEFAALTAHLKNDEFFDVANFDRAKFISTEIKPLEDGKCEVVGDLTLHGETQSIRFPAEFRFEDGGLLFAAKFKLDRSQFGMDQMLGGVEKLVSLDVSVGEKTVIPEAQEGHGGKSQEKQASTADSPSRQIVVVNLPKML